MKNVDIENYSLLIVKPKDNFFNWLVSNSDSNVDIGTIMNDYSPEDDGAYLIKKCSSFSSNEQFNKYLDGLKCDIVNIEIMKFLSHVELEEPEANVFLDEYYNVEIRDEVDYVLIENEQ